MINYIILGVLVILIILVIILIFKVKDRDTDNLDMLERLNRFEVNINKELNDNFIKMNENMESKLNNINDKVHERIDQNFEKTNKTFMNVIERLSKIDEAQKKIETLSTDIVGLQSILTDKKTRGIYGEVNLYHILSSIFGDKNDKIYKTQYTLSNGFIADSVLFAPEPLGTIAIDSKFPLEHYEIMVDKKISQTDRDKAEKLFRADMKKHIDAISEKYIIPGETTDQAILFLPAEAIFAEINAYHTNLIKYAASKKVWLTSPTTLMSLLTIIQSVLMGLERDKYTSVIHEELNKLGIEFARYRDRWDKLSRSIQTVSNDVENIHKTTEKITKRFDSISNVKIENEETISLIDDDEM